MHTNFGVVFDGYPGDTVTFTATTNNVYTLSDTGVSLTDSSGGAAIMCLITVETNSVRLSWQTDPTTTLGHIRGDGESIQIGGKKAMDDLKMRNAANGANFVVQVTPFFGKPIA